MNVGSLVNRGSTTKDEVVSKKEKMDRKTTRTKNNPRKIGVEQLIIQTNGEFINGDHKEIGREGATLADATLGRERSRLTVNQNREGRSGNAGMDKVNEGGRETHPVESRSNEVPIEAIKGFSKVKLKEESLMLPTLQVEGMDDLLGNNYVGRDMPILNKSSLGMADVLGKMGLKSIR